MTRKISSRVKSLLAAVLGLLIVLVSSTPNLATNVLPNHQTPTETAAESLRDALVYSTYLGGSNDDFGIGIAVDRAGNAYITGITASTNFPTQNPLQAAFGGSEDAFITKLNPLGDALVYSTYLGGSNIDQGYGIAVDRAGNAYITGQTFSTNFPTQNPLQAAFGGGADDALITKLNPLGDALVYSTYLGGSNADFGSGIAVDRAGNAYITGSTNSTNFPTQNPLQTAFGTNPAFNYNAFVSKLTDREDNTQSRENESETLIP